MSFKAFSEKARYVLPGTLSCEDFLTILLLCYVMLCHVMSCHVLHRIEFLLAIITAVMYLKEQTYRGLKLSILI